MIKTVCDEYAKARWPGADRLVPARLPQAAVLLPLGCLTGLALLCLTNLLLPVTGPFRVGGGDNRLGDEPPFSGRR